MANNSKIGRSEIGTLALVVIVKTSAASERLSTRRNGFSIEMCKITK